MIIKKWDRWRASSMDSELAESQRKQNLRIGAMRETCSHSGDTVEEGLINYQIVLFAEKTVEGGNGNLWR
jgi:hypothetical protein